MARTERSAGVVVYRVAPATGVRHYLLLDYGRHWDFPKGHLEPGEDDAAAALREFREETGITAVTLAPHFKHEVSYYFRDRKGRLTRKTVAFFLGQTASDEVSLSHEHVGYAFLPIDAALARVTYANARGLLRLAAEELGDIQPTATGDRVSL